MSLVDQLQTLKTAAFGDIQTASSTQALDELRVKFLGKKGLLTDILKGVSSLEVSERPKIGQVANDVKTEIQALYQEKLGLLQTQERDAKLKEEAVDVSMPGYVKWTGLRHPLNQVLLEVQEIFQKLGFSVKEGPDVESDYYNFEALNIPKDHPARDMHDTFYLKNGDVLRTHTSPVQIRTMKAQTPPIRIIVPGKVYRCDTDVTHSPMFHQVEGLYVDTDVTFAQLKGTLSHFLKEFFGQDKKVRFRPSYFPFTEPSTEVDVQCVKCEGHGCNICKRTGWLEILGAGMVNRKVFESVGYDPDVVTGFAFGLGIERLAMLKYGIPDIRLFYENDKRFLSQFGLSQSPLVAAMTAPTPAMPLYPSKVQVK
jgi:phenylalanyl-tRNA synthetase alpha chain